MTNTATDNGGGQVTELVAINPRYLHAYKVSTGIDNISATSVSVIRGSPPGVSSVTVG